jgi:hypothetical protein
MDTGFHAGARLSDLRKLCEESPQAAQGGPVYFFRQRNTGLSWIETDCDPRTLFDGTPMEVCMEYRTLYAAPPLSSEPQADA